MNKVNDILTDIMDNNLEVEIYKILHNMILKSYDRVVDENRDNKAKLNVIKKINNNKNEAINNLCE